MPNYLSTSFNDPDLFSNSWQSVDGHPQKNKNKLLFFQLEYTTTQSLKYFTWTGAENPTYS